MTFIFLELEKFQKILQELDGDVLEGMYFCFKNMATLDERPEILKHRIFGKIFEVSELLNMDNVTRSKVLDKMTTERDLRNQMRYFKETTLAEGREQGLAAGRAETVSKMLAAGISAQIVADALGITVEECESYR